MADSIFERMKPTLKNGDIDQAIIHGVNDIRDILKGNGLQIGLGEQLLTIAIFVGVPALIIGCCVFSCVQNHKWAKCKRKLEKIEEMKKARELSKKFQIKHCPICLEDFPPGSEVDSNDDDDRSGVVIQTENERSRQLHNRNKEKKKIKRRGVVINFAKNVFHLGFKKKIHVQFVEQHQEAMKIITMKNLNIILIVIMIKN